MLTLVILYLGLFTTLAAHIARSLFQLTKKLSGPWIHSRLVSARGTRARNNRLSGNLRAPLPHRRKPVLIPSQRIQHVQRRPGILILRLNNRANLAECETGSAKLFYSFKDWCLLKVGRGNGLVLYSWWSRKMSVEWSSHKIFLNIFIINQKLIVCLYIFTFSI